MKTMKTHVSKETIYTIHSREPDENYVVGRIISIPYKSIFCKTDIDLTHAHVNAIAAAMLEIEEEENRE